VDPQDEWTVAERDASARRALAGYTERRRARRGEDTFFGSADALVEAAEAGLTADEVGSRRVEVVGEALETGMSPELAGLLYDIARDEGLDPALAYEVVRSGLGVLPPPDGLVNAPSQRETDKYAPEWVVSPATPPDLLLRERTLRFSFRRLRRLLEENEQVEDALLAFGREPDVGPVGY
jgi:hypothetical protein